MQVNSGAEKFGVKNPQSPCRMSSLYRCKIRNYFVLPKITQKSKASNPDLLTSSPVHFPLPSNQTQEIIQLYLKVALPLKGHELILFHGCLVFHGVDVPHFLCPVCH